MTHVLQGWIQGVSAAVTVGAASVAWAKDVTVASTTAPRIEFVELPNPDLVPAQDLSPYGMFLAADGVVKAVILSLITAFFIAWSIYIAKYLQITMERRSLKSALPKLLQATRLKPSYGDGASVVWAMLVGAEDEIAVSTSLCRRLVSDGVKDRIAIRLERLESATRRRAGGGVAILAIIASTAPFVGLFGAVWGIMTSFVIIAEARAANLSVMAPGIAAALLSTAFGIIVAVPAVVIYNLLLRILASFKEELGDVSAAVLCIAGREIDLVTLED